MRKNALAMQGKGLWCDLESKCVYSLKFTWSTARTGWSALTLNMIIRWSQKCVSLSLFSVCQLFATQPHEILIFYVLQSNSFNQCIRALADVNYAAQYVCDYHMLFDWNLIISDVNNMAVRTNAPLILVISSHEGNIWRKKVVETNVFSSYDNKPSLI